MNAIKKNEVSMFKVGDFVLPISNEFSNEVCELTEDYVGQDFKYKTKKGGFGYIVKSFMPTAWRHATPEEIAAGHRIDTNTGVTVITPSGTSKVKGGLTAFIDMGDDSHIENHVSPNCKKFDERVGNNETN